MFFTKLQCLSSRAFVEQVPNTNVTEVAIICKTILPDWATRNESKSCKNPLIFVVTSRP
jgi:hypothetical protein